MNTAETALLGAVTRELAEILRNCVTETRRIEDSINTWLSRDLHANQFPLIDIQRLDFLYQAQNDLADILTHTSAALLEDGRLDADSVSDLLAVAKLDEIRSRLVLANGVTSAPSPQRTRDDGSTEFF